MSIALAAIGLGLSVAGRIGGRQRRKKEAEQAAELQRAGARDYRRRGKIQLGRMREQGKAFMGGQRVAASLGGTTGGGSTAMALGASQQAIDLDINQTRTNLKKQFKLMKQGADLTEDAGKPGFGERLAGLGSLLGGVAGLQQQYGDPQAGVGITGMANRRRRRQYGRTQQQSSPYGMGY